VYVNSYLSLEVYAAPNADHMLMQHCIPELRYTKNRYPCLYGFSELVDEKIDRFHVVGVQFLLGRVVGGHICEDSIEAGLEVADS
jgi:hypothetical protein